MFGNENLLISNSSINNFSDNFNDLNLKNNKLQKISQRVYFFILF